MDRGRRRALRLKQRDLLALAGCSLRLVHTPEAGKATVGLDKVLGVLDVLGLEVQIAVGQRHLAVRRCDVAEAGA